ncbi:MAG: aminotransferase class V-fold PLP-dependent enzyme [Bryobacterales bacterium]|nr:aminotransferase class V-fold PLP-dependent enzyme [Bryobacterales bacterium]
MFRWLSRDRRAFLRSLVRGSLAGGLAAVPPASAAGRKKRSNSARDVIGELGVRTFLNAAGTYTRLTASKMPPSVLSAIQVASTRYVDLEELHQKAGDRVAELLECEAALVTAGCASALTLATAACAAGTDPARIRKLPDTTGMKNEVVLQKAHRNGYDHAIRNCGVRLVEVETAAEMETAISDRTAMLFFLNHNEHDGSVGHEDFVRIGRRHGVPTLNDAAADVPPVDNLFRFTKMGYDLVAYSGGKGLLGPQSTGLLLGRRKLIEAARLNNNPHSDSVARTNKVNKEEIVGMLVALELFLERDHDAAWREWTRRCRRIGNALAGLPGVTTEVFVPEIANAVPHLRIRWNYESAGLNPEDAAERLRAGEPSVEVRPRYEEGLEVAVWMLDPGEERIVGRMIRGVLGEAIQSSA